ncbi:MAG: hypothetical protein J5867_11670 [Prevotella sp.]|nr:hypothetical protein [Prevotella sp.]
MKTHQRVIDHIGANEELLAMQHLIILHNDVGIVHYATIPTAKLDYFSVISK